MKIMLCTTPIRPVPTNYPPLGSMAVIQALRAAGYQPLFYDIDALRPSFEEVIERFRKEKPDVIGISAVVSTAYGYVKNLATRLKRALPDTKIVLGGNLAASAELLHRFCGVDVCVAGEGEKVIVNLMRHYERHREREDFGELAKIPGITFLNPSGEMVFTGYEAAIPAHELFDPDWSILEEFSDINRFVSDPFSREDFAQDPRSKEPHRQGKKMALLISTKGCVARCTFCHRWDKGFRQIPPHKVIARIKYLMERYNVGFIMFGDENFGSDLKALDEIIESIKPLDVLWQVAGVRARTLSLERLKRMREAGCVSLYYGFETGSPDMLKVMEKNLSLEHNLQAARLTFEAGLYTCYQLVLAMPGETHKTISDTIKMVQKITEFLPRPPYTYLSVNYIQALPGTAVYEYARKKGLIGPTLEDEDAYLLTISDVNAGDDTKFLNFTGSPTLAVQSWRPRILYEATAHWYRQRRGKREKTANLEIDLKDYRSGGGYFNRHKVMGPWLLLALYPVRRFAVAAWTLLGALRRSPAPVVLSHLWEWVRWPFIKKEKPFEASLSLRQVVSEIADPPETVTEQSMAPLRLGR